jgi:arylsulfatase
MFSPYEGSLRVPFLIRYPQKVPSGQVSNEMVHIVDILPTLAKWTNSDLPKDRILDGVDQTNFLTGKTAKSSRETVLIYVGNDLFGVKWRNWKMLLKEIARNGSYAIQNLAYPSIFNLIVDPKEEEPEKFYLDDTWAEIPLWNAIEEHQISIEKDRGSPSS